MTSAAADTTFESASIAASAPADGTEICEADEFARMLGVARADRGALVRMGSPEQADEIADYEALVADPIKSRLTTDPDFFHRIKADLVTELVTRRLPGRSPMLLRVLDVGCGTGSLLTHPDARFGHVRGCDPSRRMVRAAGAQACYMPSPMQLPFDVGSFDVIVCACVYHHIEPNRRLHHLLEIGRVLAPGGLLLVFEHNRRNPLTRLIVRRCPIDSGAKLLTGGLTRRLLQRAGFEGVRNRYYLFLPQRLYRAVGRIERLLSLTGLGGQFCTHGAKPAS
ncbi:MAG: methyltransferase domain-containing protein [Planctomycetes bacterium]|nr:methyltransferase domain-containing protein [Planctomycetota bacterium]